MTTFSHPDRHRIHALPGAARRRTTRRGFTIVEVLLVVAVIAILLALLIPVASTVRDNAMRNKTRAQLAQYATAYEAFRADRGHYPSMGAPGAEFNLRGNNAVFVETLTGRGLDGNPATNAYALRVNPNRERYYTFTAAEFAPAGDSREGEIVDAFGNPNIVVVSDRRGGGVVRSADFQILPAERRPDTLMGGVFFYTANPDEDPEWEWIVTWE
ncbi:MAG: prepilin-type N-terminal cleavage/methylation domain-containing protein [Opitutales bacterium]|nr:prepilin-type N-terminal cleavage/methylation domain-containing protein [Opitutales bacterium]